MKTNIAQTSLESWCKLQMENKINANQTIILDMFKKVMPNAISNYDIALMLNWGINRVTPRVNELRKLGKLVCVGRKYQLQTNRNVMIYTLPECAYLYEVYDGELINCPGGGLTPIKQSSNEGSRSSTTLPLFHHQDNNYYY